VRRALAAAAALTLLAPVTTLAGSAPATGAAQAREKFDTRVFARVARPGFPAYVHVHTTNGRVYAGTYTNPAGDTQRSRVFEWSARGALLRSWTVPGQDLSQDHGVQVATNDAAGRLVLLEKSTRRIMRLNVKTGRFTRYSRLPDGSIPNYAAWGPSGALFVTDYAKGTIWRVPKGGGTARAWFSDPRLQGVEFGTTGIVMGPGRKAFYISQQTTSAPGFDPTRGFLARLRLRDDGRPGAFRVLWTSLPSDLPDGFGIGRSGRFYLANAGLTNQLVVLAPDGTELRRFPETPGSGENGSPIPFDTPSNATFLGRRVLVANQSFSGDTSHHAILDVYVGEEGFATYVPRTAGVR
jgi:sugar lactone lactonase YvrE